MKKKKNRAQRRAHELPPVLVLEVVQLNEEGEALAIPAKWEDERRHPPQILLTGKQAPGVGDNALVKLTSTNPKSLTAKVLKILPKRVTRTVVGVYQNTKRGGLLEPVNRKQKQSFFIAEADRLDARSGELVIAQALPGQRNKQLGLHSAKITERLGDLENPKCYSLIAIFNQDIPVDFPSEAIAEAEQATDPVPDSRVDLRDIPLITIDGADARDFDDAVFAEKDGDGWHLLVAIADVAHYVKLDSALDQEALNRGNSTYFPDRVVPMLPEALSNGLCSLNPKVDRYCLAVHLWVDGDGILTRYQFVRGIMRSHARLTYEQAQAQWDVKEGEAFPWLEPLYGAYQCLLQHRDKRGAMELDLPEYQIALDEEGHVEKVSRRERLHSHKLIEEFMVCANIAAGLELQEKKLPGVFRIHEPPSADKIEELRFFMKSLGFSLSATPGVADLNKLITKVRGTPMEALVSGAILRAQMQAKYLPQNMGHFGLGLTHYAHFTSPIRRYSDLITHRAIIAAIEHGAVNDNLAAQAEHISQTERRSMLAEREANDRYITAFMAESGEAEFEGSITSVGSYGVFVTLHDTGASGLIRMSDLGNEFFYYEEKLHCLIGRDTGQRFQLGQKLVVTLKQADMQLGSLSFMLVEAGTPPPMELILPPPRKMRKRNDRTKSAPRKGRRKRK
jgi:ribonuclease R